MRRWAGQAGRPRPSASPSGADRAGRPRRGEQPIDTQICSSRASPSVSCTRERPSAPASARRGEAPTSGRRATGFAWRFPWPRERPRRSRHVRRRMDYATGAPSASGSLGVRTSAPRSSATSVGGKTADGDPRPALRARRGAPLVDERLGAAVASPYPQAIGASHAHGRRQLGRHGRPAARQIGRDDLAEAADALLSLRGSCSTCNRRRRARVLDAEPLERAVDPDGAAGARAVSAGHRRLGQCSSGASSGPLRASVSGRMRAAWRCRLPRAVPRAAR